ncbi:MAG: hypothetical protein Q8M07_19075 [Prosthecobacter sp.]|nr:hypothetical protein [Prosthecobacter sp.]
MKTLLLSVVLSLVTLTATADEFAIRGRWFKGKIEQISQDGTKVYVTDAAQSYRGWWEPAADLDPATRERLGFDTSPAEKLALANKALADAKAAQAATDEQARQRAAYLERLQIMEAEQRAAAAYLASEQAARDAIAARKAADPRAIAEAQRVQRAKEFYQQTLDQQAVNAFNALVEVQQLELLRKLGYLR